tara:strand:- start:680 stop:1585 length:906 start_codon:yes stop_codon:yes gene_type:complete
MILVFTFSLKAQDPHFTQTNRANIYLNPASVGNLESWTVSHQYRDQWSNITGSYVTNHTAVQYGFKKAFKGIGVHVLTDDAGSKIYTTRLSIPVAFGWELSKSIRLNVGVEAAYIEKSVNWDNLTFGDMIDNKLGFVNNTSDTLYSTSVGNLDFSAGMELVVAKLKFGIAGAHLTEPNESFFGNTSDAANLPFKLSTYLNYDIFVGGNLIVTPSVLYLNQRDFSNAMFSTTTTYKFIKLMVGYRTNDAAIMGLAVHFNKFDIGYTYDLTTSQLTNETGGSHEVGIRFRFGKNKEGEFDNAF